MKIGIIGQGFVGNAVYQKFKNFFEVLTFDKKENLSNSNIYDIKKECKVVFVCVPTPMNKDGSCNISIVDSVVNLLSDCKDLIIINKSTVVPGTTEELSRKYKNVKIIFNPEFLTERNAINDFNNQERIILGGPRPATTLVKNIYTKVFPSANIIKTGATHAEMVKYFTNTFLATKVSFANEIYVLCSKLGLDYDKVLEYSLTDKRIGKSHMYVPGPDGDLGFGGHCFPKDISALVDLSDKLGSSNNVLKAVLQTNEKVRNNRDWENMKGRAVN